MFAELLGTKAKQKGNWHLLGFSSQASSALRVPSSLIWKVLLAPLYRQGSEGLGQGPGQLGGLEGAPGAQGRAESGSQEI